MKKPYPVLLWVLLLTSCVTSLTPGGKSVEVVTDAQKERACRSISVIAEGSTWAANDTRDAERAMNKVRNRAAELGGNAIRILKTETGPVTTIVTVEVLNCDFTKLAGP